MKIFVINNQQQSVRYFNLDKIFDNNAFKRQYKQLTKIFHPDNLKTGNKEIFQHIQYEHDLIENNSLFLDNKRNQLLYEPTQQKTINNTQSSNRTTNQTRNPRTRTDKTPEGYYKYSDNIYRSKQNQQNTNSQQQAQQKVNKEFERQQFQSRREQERQVQTNEFIRSRQEEYKKLQEEARKKTKEKQREEILKARKLKEEAAKKHSEEFIKANKNAYQKSKTPKSVVKEAVPIKEKPENIFNNVKHNLKRNKIIQEVTDDKHIKKVIEKTNILKNKIPTKSLSKADKVSALTDIILKFASMNSEQAKQTISPAVKKSLQETQKLKQRIMKRNNNTIHVTNFYDLKNASDISKFSKGNYSYKL